MDPYIEVRFPVRGRALPLDHGWALYAAVSRLQPVVHEAAEIRLGPVEGCIYQGEAQLRVTERSFLPVRLPASRVREVYVLAGRSLEVLGHAVSLGVPRTRMLAAEASLHARPVVITNRTEWVTFEAEARRQLEALGVVAEIQPGRRRVMTVKGGYRNVGFAVGLNGLSEEAALKVQREGLGSRRSMGAGFFRAGPLPRSAEATLRDLGLEGES